MKRVSIQLLDDAALIELKRRRLLCLVEDASELTADLLGLAPVQERKILAEVFHSLESVQERLEKL
jgi:hypothetical protein